MKIEMHVHTSEGSPCANVDAENIVKAYAQTDYDAIVITNHFDQDLLKKFGKTDKERIARHLLGYQKSCETGKQLGIQVLLGVEIRLEPGVEDFLIYGIDEEFLYEHSDLCFLTQKELYDLCHSCGAVLYQAHPFRKPCVPQNPDYLDGVEVNQRPNGENNNEQLEAWLKNYPHLKLISGSDCHDYDQVGFGGIILDRVIHSEKELAECLQLIDAYRLCGHRF